MTSQIMSNMSRALHSMEGSHLVPGWDPHDERALSTDDHIRSVRERFQDWNCERFGNKMVAFRGRFSPTETSTEYDIIVLYKMCHFPQVAILEPEIREDAPHRWPDGTLCLFDTRVPEWDPSKSLGEYIFPWIAEWLLLYELWRETGVWHGPEADE